MSTSDAMSGSEIARPSRRTLWIGRILSALPVLLLLFGASGKVMRNPAVVEAFSAKYGYPGSAPVPIGLAELACAVLYVIPQTAVLGAMLATAYLGGAVATHVRASENFVAPIIVGFVIWLGLYLREERLRDLVPIRRVRR
jgi:hypothetical protein